MMAEKVREREEVHIELDLFGVSPVADYTPRSVVLTYVRGRGSRYRFDRGYVRGREHDGGVCCLLHPAERAPEWIRDLADTHHPDGPSTVRPLWRVKALS